MGAHDAVLGGGLGADLGGSGVGVRRWLGDGRRAARRARERRGRAARARTGSKATGKQRQAAWPREGGRTRSMSMVEVLEDRMA